MCAAWLLQCPKKNQHKFKESGWQVVYYVTAWCAGFYIAVLSPDVILKLDAVEDSYLPVVDHKLYVFISGVGAACSCGLPCLCYSLVC